MAEIDDLLSSLDKVELLNLAQQLAVNSFLRPSELERFIRQARWEAAAERARIADKRQEEAWTAWEAQISKPGRLTSISLAEREKSERSFKRAAGLAHRLRRAEREAWDALSALWSHVNLETNDA